MTRAENAERIRKILDELYPLPSIRTPLPSRSATEGDASSSVAPTADEVSW